MALLDFALVIRAIDKASGVIEGVGQHVERLNDQFKRTSHLREYSENLAKIGLVGVGLGAAIGAPLVESVRRMDELNDHMARLGTSLGDVKNKSELMAQALQFVKQESVATGFSAADLTEGLFEGTSGFLKFGQAIAATQVGAKLARATSGDLGQTVKALTTLMFNFGDSSKTPIQNAQTLADKMAVLETQFKFTNLGELTDAMKEAAPVMEAFGVNLDQGLGGLAALSAGGLTGESAGEGMLEILTQLHKASQKLGFTVFAGANGKGVDFLRTLEGIKDQYGDISSNKELSARFEEAFGARAGSRVAILLNHLDQMRAATNASAHSFGAVDRGEAEFEKRGTLAFEKVQRAIEALQYDLGAALLPQADELAKVLVWVGASMDSWATAHPELTRFIAEFGALSSVALVMGGGLALGAASLAGFTSFIPAVMEFAQATRLTTILTKGWASAQWLVNAAMDANPIALAVIGAVALGAAAYEVYEHWTAVSAFFKRLGPEILGYLEWPFKALPAAIEASIGAITGAASRIAHAIGRFFVGHSPIPEGPLHDLDLSGQIARSLRSPAPVLQAIQRVAAAVAIAAPMITVPAAGALGAPAAPATILASHVESSFPRGGNTPSSLTINVSAPVTIHHTGSELELGRALEKHRRQIARLVADEVATRRRTAF